MLWNTQRTKKGNEYTYALLGEHVRNNCRRTLGRSSQTERCRKTKAVLSDVKSQLDVAVDKLVSI